MTAVQNAICQIDIEGGSTAKKAAAPVATTIAKSMALVANNSFGRETMPRSLEKAVSNRLADRAAQPAVSAESGERTGVRSTPSDLSCVTIAIAPDPSR